MTTQPTPDLSNELARRIRLVRRDIGDLLFHFTRGAPPNWHELRGHRINTAQTAWHVLGRILIEGALKGSSKWTYGIDTVCFTEAPIQEFNSVFSLNSIAHEEHLRPRYEPYGVAVSKAWLFAQGGRPVIYDHPAAQEMYPRDLLYRFCPYDPGRNIDYTWEREWRVQTKALRLDPRQTIVIVPTAAEAFELVYEYANAEADVDGSGEACGVFHQPKWLAVSLDMFGFQYAQNAA
jgi:hypothetical protein